MERIVETLSEEVEGEIERALRGSEIKVELESALDTIRQYELSVKDLVRAFLEDLQRGEIKLEDFKPLKWAKNRFEDKVISRWRREELGELFAFYFIGIIAAIVYKVANEKLGAFKLI